MNFEDALLCKQIDETRDNIHKLREGLSQVADIKEIIDKSSSSAAELRKLKEGFDETIYDETIAYTDASIKVMDDTTFALGLVANGLEALDRAVDRYDAECGNLIAAIEKRSGEKYSPQHEQAVLDDMAERLAKMLFGAVIEAIKDGTDDIPLSPDRTCGPGAEDTDTDTNEEA